MLTVYKNNTSVYHRKLCGIYSISFNHKPDCYYVGQSRNIHKRYRDHRKCTHHPKYKDIKLYRVARKHGWHNAVVYLLEECNAANLNEREIYHSERLNSYTNGYNSMPCGGYNPMDDKRLRAKCFAKQREALQIKKEIVRLHNESIPLDKQCMRSGGIKQLISRLEQQQVDEQVIKGWPDIFTWRDVMPCYNTNITSRLEKRKRIYVIGKRDGRILYKKGRPPKEYNREVVLDSCTHHRINKRNKKHFNSKQEMNRYRSNKAREFWTQERRALAKKLTQEFWTPERRLLAMQSKKQAALLNSECNRRMMQGVNGII